MAINPLYIPLFNIEEVILDKDTGLPLAGGVVSFFRDSQRLTPKPVYQIAGTSPNYTFVSVGSVLTLGLSGTFVDQNGDPFVPYAYPYDSEGNLDLYYVTVVSEGAVDQFTREAVPYVDTSGVPPSERTSTENEIANPQFVEVNIPLGVVTTVNVTGTNTVTPVAPGWDIISTGTGTIALEVLQPTSAGVPTNPPFALSIAASAGLGASVTLRQQFLNSPSLFRGGFLSGSITAAVLSGGSSFITMTYAPSTGSSTEIIPSTAITTDGAYHTISNNAAIPQQPNDPAQTGLSTINITIPTSRTIAVTSIQAVGTASSVNIPFDEQSSGRQKDHLFHLYEHAVAREPKQSLLVGWNFGLNPWQLRAPAPANVAFNGYTADQTIFIQQAYVQSATGNNINVGRSTFNTDNFAIQITPVTANNQFAMLQYIDPTIVRPYWGKTVSLYIKAFCNTTHSTNFTFKVRLIYKSGLPNTIAQADPVASWTALSDPVAAVGYTFMAPPLDPTFTVPSDNSVTEFFLDGITLPNSDNINMTLGVMIYTMNQMNETGTADILFFEDVCLAPNEFAIASPNLTADDVLRQCQYYYESSYDNGIPPGTSTTAGLRIVEQLAINSSPIDLIARSFSIQFSTAKRANPVVTLWGATGSSNNVSGTISNGGAGAPFANIAVTNWNQNNLSTKSVGYVANTIASLRALAQASNTPEAYIAFHYTADARLGI
jgi:hypothetical protein